MILVDKGNVYHTYVYLDPTRKISYETTFQKFEFEPFYVGYGQYERYLDHLLDAKKGKYKRIFRINKIMKLLREGHEPIIIKLRDDLSLDDAKAMEIQLIAELGTRRPVVGVKRGPLTNLTRGGDGAAGYVQVKRPAEWYDRNSGKIGVMKDGLLKLIFPDDLVKAQTEGWILGFGERVASCGTQDTVWMKKDGAQTCIKRELVAQAQAEGWSLGSYNVTSKGKVHINKEGIHKQVDKDKLDQAVAEGWSVGIGLNGEHWHASKRRWINKDGKNKYVKLDQLDDHLQAGWIKGRIFKWVKTPT